MADVVDPINTAVPEKDLLADDFGSLKLQKGDFSHYGKVSENPKTAAIVMAGGSGLRFGMSGNKLLVEVEGKPILTWSMLALDSVADIGFIVVVCSNELISDFNKLAIKPYNFITPIKYAPAGLSRQESAFNGLELVPEEYEFILTHDGARPLLSPSTVLHMLSELKGNPECEGTVVGHPSIDTLKIVEDNIIVGTPDRDMFWIVQTPQVFRSGFYRRAHGNAMSDGFVASDDACLVERMGGQVRVVEGKRTNIKFTFPEDLDLIHSALVAQNKRREEGLEYEKKVNITSNGDGLIG
ncbi:MAG: 2-C-methyl-D-erythritol 4-phosphate cytidylyltransferase [Eggerthellaceae bacterium]|nr:2-C-methyl-D-erythritol 4-phosphate cytidylyltransferase [Eggerthellaceae bacterium]